MTPPVARGTSRIEIAEVGFPLAKAADLAHGIGDDGDGDAMNPGGEGGVAAKIGEPVECTNERVLRELPCELRVAR